MSGRRALSATLAVALLSALSLPASSDAGHVVVRVGTSALDAAQVTRRLDALPAFQLVTFGDTAQAIRRNFVERVLVPELAAEEEAKRLRLRERPELREALHYELVQALGDALREELIAQGVASDAAVREYYQRHLAEYASGERIRIWRIAVRDEATAREILTLAAGEKGVKKWTELARDKSEDKATHLRDGDLGFVRADGSTDVPELRVDPALYVAAAKVRDGELVPEPLREGERWAVVWRRGTLPATKRTLEEEAGTIRQILLRTKLEEAVERIAADLRKRHVQAVTYEPLDSISEEAFGEVAARTLPSALPRHPARSQPVKGDRGYR